MNPSPNQKSSKASWKPREIIVHEAVREDEVTHHILSQCPKTPVHFVNSGNPRAIVEASDVLGQAGGAMLDKILAGKQVLYVAPATQVVDTFHMPDERTVCPDFDRLKLASNGCYYRCDWCYLKLTYRAAFPFITVRAQYNRIKELLHKRLARTLDPMIFNTGELADSLSLEHLTGAARTFIPWIGNTENGHLFLLTKSDNVDPILDLDHNGHTFLAWTLNAPSVSRKFEIGAPPFERRLEAASKAQEAGYPVRIRLDPIVPFEGWKEAYAETIARILETVDPERITLGTLRFEEGFFNMRHSLLTTGPDLPRLMETMEPMFPPKRFRRAKRPKAGKYSFPEAQRIEIFSFILREIRKHPAGETARLALCKESARVWKKTGLPLSTCSCVCQLDSVDMRSTP